MERTHLRGAAGGGRLPAYREFMRRSSRAERGAHPKTLLLSVLEADRLASCGVRLHVDIVELDYKASVSQSWSDWVGSDAHRIDYRHIIHSHGSQAWRLPPLRVPRGALLPQSEFDAPYDALLAKGSDQADLRVRSDPAPGCLAMAQETVERCSRVCWAASTGSQYEASAPQVRAHATPHGVPFGTSRRPISPIYDRLLARTTKRCAYEHAIIATDRDAAAAAQALHLQSFSNIYVELAQRARCRRWSHVRYLTELVTPGAR